MRLTILQLSLPQGNRTRLIVCVIYIFGLGGGGGGGGGYSGFQVTGMEEEGFFGFEVFDSRIYLGRKICKVFFGSGLI